MDSHGSQTNNATFGDNSRLLIRFDSAGNHDRLTVYGALNLTTSTTSDRLELSVPPGVARGTYTLVSASNGVKGTFTVTSGLPFGQQITYTANAVLLTTLSEGAMILLR